MNSRRTNRPTVGLVFTVAAALLANGATHAFFGYAQGAMNKPSPYTSNLRIESRFAPSDVALDGDLDKAFWKGVRWIHFDHDMSGKKIYPHSQTRVAARWTATSIYFAFRCHYSEHNIFEGEDPAKERWELWLRDVAEVFINPQPEQVPHYYEFEVAPNNQWLDLEIDKTKTPFNDASWDSHFEHAARIDTRNHEWTCEMRIPLPSMGVKAVAKGGEWRVNFYRMEGHGEFSERQLMAWSTIPEGDSFHVPTRFGIIRFVE
jgi:Carbohydrate family 9 binding domain-like